jgi:hypothetical protein
MRTTLIVIAVISALGAAPAAAKNNAGGQAAKWSETHRQQYRALKRQVRGEYRALKRIKRKRALSPVEKQRYDTLKNARMHFSESAIKRAGGYGSVALAGGLMGAAIFDVPTGMKAWQYTLRLGTVSVCSLGLTGGVAYTAFEGSRRSRARGIAEARKAGVHIPDEIRTSARRTLLLEARAKRDVARMMAEPSLKSSASVRALAHSLR